MVGTYSLVAVLYFICVLLTVISCPEPAVKMTHKPISEYHNNIIPLICCFLKLSSNCIFKCCVIATINIIVDTTLLLHNYLYMYLKRFSTIDACTLRADGDVFYAIT